MNTRIYIYDLGNYRISASHDLGAPEGVTPLGTDQADEPIFWVGELGRFIGFDEMDYDTGAGNWYVKQAS